MKLVTITGPSCSGKTTFLNELVANHGFAGVTSHTTRPPRKGEIEGKDYYFTDPSKFEFMIENDELIEHVTFSGFEYGVSVNEIANAEKSGKIPVLIVEPVGLGQIIKYCATNKIGIYPIYVNGDPETLIHRYLARANDEDFSDHNIGFRNARRILSLVKEQQTWNPPPWKDGNYPEYKMYIDSLNADNTQSYIKQLKESEFVRGKS